MQIMSFISDLIIPVVFVVVLANGFLKKIDMYGTFIEGAKDGFTTVLNILPTLIGLMVAVGILRASGALDIISALISPLTNSVGYPKELAPITFMRLVSSSASTGMLLDIYKNYGTDSYLGRLVSVMMSCTETVFYTMSVYFLSVKITKTRYTLAGALIANFAGVAASVVVTQQVFGK